MYFLSVFFLTISLGSFSSFDLVTHDHRYVATDCSWQTWQGMYKYLSYRDCWSVLPTLLRPQSRGYVALRSSSPFHKPIIVHNYYTDPEGQDIRVMVEGRPPSGNDARLQLDGSWDCRGEGRGGNSARRFSWCWLVVAHSVFFTVFVFFILSSFLIKELLPQTSSTFPRGSGSQGESRWRTQHLGLANTRACL